MKKIIFHSSYEDLPAFFENMQRSTKKYTKQTKNVLKNMHKKTKICTTFFLKSLCNFHEIYLFIYRSLNSIY